MVMRWREILLHFWTIGEYSGHAFAKSQYTVWADEQDFVEVYIAELGTVDRETPPISA